MYIFDMTFHICLVQTFVWAVATSKMRAFWIHFATILYVSTQQRLQRIGFSAKHANVSLLHNMRRHPLSWHHSNFIQLIVRSIGTSMRQLIVFCQLLAVGKMLHVPHKWIWNKSKYNNIEKPILAAKTFKYLQEKICHNGALFLLLQDFIWFAMWVCMFVCMTVKSCISMLTNFHISDRLKTFYAYIFPITIPNSIKFRLKKILINKK